MVVENSKFEAVTHVGMSALLSGPPGVMPGETMTVEFDVQVGPGGFDDVWDMTIVPEPTAIAFLSLGGLILLRSKPFK